jgi:hypothetical protein
MYPDYQKKRTHNRLPFRSWGLPCCPAPRSPAPGPLRDPVSPEFFSPDTLTKTCNSAYYDASSG